MHSLFSSKPGTSPDRTGRHDFHNLTNGELWDTLEAVTRGNGEAQEIIVLLRSTMEEQSDLIEKGKVEISLLNKDQETDRQALITDDCHNETNCDNETIVDHSEIIELQKKTIEDLKEQISKGVENCFNGRYSDRPEVQKAIKSQIMGKGEVPNKWIQRFLPFELPSLWRQRAFHVHGVYGFIQFSGYRGGSQSFSAPGLIPRYYPKENRRLEGCKWTGNDGNEVEGSLTLHTAPQLFDQTYETAVLTCDVTADTGTTGGHVVARVDQEDFVMYREDEWKDHDLEPKEPFQYEVAYCSPLFHDAMIARQVWEWLEFHRVIHNVTHFFLYDAGGMDEEMTKMLDPYVDKKLATITDMREVLIFTVVSWGQKLAIADCIYRTRYLAKWVFMGDLDEYIHVRPPDTLMSLLPQHELKAWVSHGAFNWDLSRCLDHIGQNKNGKSEELFMVERIRYRSKVAHCITPEGMNITDVNMCYSAWGHRKYFLNPRRVPIAHVHDPLETEDGHFFYGDKALWHDHYRGLSTQTGSEKFCNKPINATGDENYYWTDEVAELIPLVKMCNLRKKSQRCVKKVFKIRQKKWK